MTPIEEKGSMRGGDVVADTQAFELCWAFIRAVQQATGQVRLYDNEIAHARKLAMRDVSAADVKAATLNVCDQAIQRRAGVPSLADVVRHFDVQADK